MKTPPAVPRVLIDDELWQVCERLEFNPQAFYQFAKAAGFTDKQISTYTIHLRSSSTLGLAGKYHPRSRTAEIYLGDILSNQPQQTGKLLPGEQRLSRNTQFSRVASRVLAHETGHHSRAGRTRGKLATAGTNSLFVAPVATAGVGMLHTSVTGAPAAGLAAFIAEATAVLAFSYHRSSQYDHRTDPEKLFNYHRRRFAEKPAYTTESHTPTLPLIKIHLK